MDDRTLLERAARAAGIGFNNKRTSYPSPALYRGVSGPVDEQGWWNPLTDDGDALRLAVKLNLDILQDPVTSISNGVEVVANEGGDVKVWAWEERAPDPYAATRRAIVRAAAAMAKDEK